LNRQERRRQRKQQQKSGEVSSGISPQVNTNSLMDKAADLYASGNLDEAAELCLDASAGAPLESEPFHLLALIRYRQGRLQDAGEQILEAITRNDTNPDIHANCGAIMNMLGRHPEAEAACRHVIELKPNNPEAYNNLAVALEMQGRLDEAREACEAALVRKPDYVEAHINLGNLYTRSGDYIGGVESYAKAISMAPDNPTARANLSVALLRLNHIDEAILQAEEALKAMPDYVEGLNALGNAKLAKRSFSEAEAAFRKAYTIQPAHNEAGLNLAATLHKQGKSADSIATYKEVLTLNPTSTDAENGLGVVLLATGEIKSAISAFRRAIDGTHVTADAYYNLASAGDVISDDDFKAINALLEDPTLSGVRKVNLHFALAEQYNQGGNFIKAMANYNTGNGLRKEALRQNEIGFDADQLDQDVDDIIRVFSRDLIFRTTDLGCGYDVPIIICGMPRSGTTLLEQIISSHPNVKSIGEAGLASTLLDDYPTDVSELTLSQAKTLQKTVIDQIGSGLEPNNYVIDKSPFNFFYIGLIHLLFPKAKLLHCQRDPMDVGLSCYAQNFVDAHPWSTDLTDVGRYIRAESRLMGHWQEGLNIPIHTVKYEDLIANQEPQTRRIVEVLGLDWDDACLQFHKNGQTVLSASNWQVRKPLYSSSVGKSAQYGEHLAQLKNALKL
jgi:tetratricopeptide (TPR) repeat protein